MDNPTEEGLYEEAKRRVELKRKFYRNLATYVVVNVLLIIIWAFRQAVDTSGSGSL